MSKISREIKYTAEGGYGEAYYWRVTRSEDDMFGFLWSIDGDSWETAKIEDIGIEDARIISELIRTAVFA